MELEAIGCIGRLSFVVLMGNAYMGLICPVMGNLLAKENALYMVMPKDSSPGWMQWRSIR